MLQAFGAELIDYGSIPDELGQFESVVSRMLTDDPDIIVSTGAGLLGKCDFIRQVLEGNVAEILFHRVKIKPGKPNLFAKLPDGPLYFGLPGNPAAVAVGLRFFVWPAVEAMSALEPEQPEMLPLRGDYSKKQGLQPFLKGRKNPDGVEILQGQQSFQTHPFLTMSCWVVAAEQSEGLEVGQLVSTYPFSPFQSVARRRFSLPSRGHRVAMSVSQNWQSDHPSGSLKVSMPVSTPNFAFHEEREKVSGVVPR